MNARQPTACEGVLAITGSQSRITRLGRLRSQLYYLIF